MSFTAGSLAIAARVFSCVTTSTVAGNASLLPTWSKWLCVLMTVVTGRSVTEATRSRMPWPLPVSLVSTSTTPRRVTNTAVLPPWPGITNRLLRTFWIGPIGSNCCGCCASTAPAAASATSAAATMPRLK